MDKESLGHCIAQLESVRAVMKRAYVKGVARYGDVNGAVGTLENLRGAVSSWAGDLKEQADRLTEDLKAGRIRARG